MIDPSKCNSEIRILVDSAGIRLDPDPYPPQTAPVTVCWTIGADSNATLIFVSPTPAELHATSLQPAIRTFTRPGAYLYFVSVIRGGEIQKVIPTAIVIIDG